MRLVIFSCVLVTNRQLPVVLHGRHGPGRGIDPGLNNKHLEVMLSPTLLEGSDLDAFLLLVLVLVRSHLAVRSTMFAPTRVEPHRRPITGQALLQRGAAWALTSPSALSLFVPAVVHPTTTSTFLCLCILRLYLSARPLL